jgi:hypothetical protein
MRKQARFLGPWLPFCPEAVPAIVGPLDSEWVLEIDRGTGPQCPRCGPGPTNIRPGTGAMCDLAGPEEKIASGP